MERSLLLEQTTVVAPLFSANSLAIANPIPLLDPVTTATLSLSGIIAISSSVTSYFNTNSISMNARVVDDLQDLSQ